MVTFLALVLVTSDRPLAQIASVADIWKYVLYCTVLYCTVLYCYAGVRLAQGL
jgi:hypothetical protein